MLESLPTEKFQLKVFRLTTPTTADFLEGQGLAEESIMEMKALLQSSGVSDSLEELCEAPFRPKRRLKYATRFSDGTFPVFYSSLDTETAKAEACHWYSRFVGNPEEPRTAHYVCFSCSFHGSAKDLRPELDFWPELIADDYSFCNKLGAEAIELQLDGLLSPSARNENGTNIPAFTKASITNPQEVASVVITYDPSSDRVSCDEN